MQMIPKVTKNGGLTPECLRDYNGRYLDTLTAKVTLQTFQF